MSARLFISVVLIGTFFCTSCTLPGNAGAGSIHNNAQVQQRGAGKDGWWDALPRAAWTRLERVSTPADQGWFEVYRVVPGVYAIYEPGQFEEVISYLIVGHTRALLFDTGLGIGDMRSLVTTLTALPVTVLNSHSHYDHIGGNHQFERVLTTDSAYTRQRSGGLSHTEVGEFVGDGWIWKKPPAAFNRSQYAIKPFSSVATVADGQLIELGGRTLEVQLTPGHAPDALCLLDRQNGLLFTGDTFYLAPLYTHLPGADFVQYRATAHRLANLQPGVKHLLPGHNVPLANAANLAAMAGAFDAIVKGNANYVMTDGLRQYDFGEFSIIVHPAALKPLATDAGANE